MAAQESTALFWKHLADTDINGSFDVYGYSVALTLRQVLRQCGNALIQENVMKQATSTNALNSERFCRIEIITGSNDYFPVEQLGLVRFEGEAWSRFGKVMSAE